MLNKILLSKLQNTAFKIFRIYNIRNFKNITSSQVGILGKALLKKTAFFRTPVMGCFCIILIGSYDFKGIVMQKFEKKIC